MKKIGNKISKDLLSVSNEIKKAPKIIAAGNINTFHSKIKKLIHKKLKVLKNKRTKTLFLVFLLLLVVVVLLFSIQLVDIYKKGIELKQNVTDFAHAILDQDMVSAEEKLTLSETSLNNLQDSYDNLSFAGSIPVIGKYYTDGKAFVSASENAISIARIVTRSISSGEKVETVSEDGSSLRELNYLLGLAPDIASSSGELLNELIEMQKKLAVVDSEDYPEMVLGKNIRLHISDLLLALDNSVFMLSSGGGLIENVSGIAGFNGERKYLIIFQNNKELRPTGGFMTAYTIARVRSGDFQTEQSSDIYDLDDKYDPDVPAPQPIVENLQGPYLEIENYRLRDMNWNPDFPSSMALFLEEISDVGISDIDGVIALDTEVLVDIIDVIGEINVPGYGGYSNNIVELCDCEQIIYELEHFADREGPIVWSENEPGKIVEAPENYEDRKKIIGPMMNTIVGNILTLRPTKYPALFNALMENLKEKHILIYMTDVNDQLSMEELGVSGEVVDYEGDYLFVNDANLGGKKANLYVTHQVDQKIEIDGEGYVTKTIELTYRNPKPQNNWLNTVLPNYLRIYVPEGSELLEFNGLDKVDEPYEELGKTVFPGLLTVRPMGVTKVTIKYKLPFTLKNGYNLYLQKQPGKDSPKYSIRFGDIGQEFTLNTDKEIIIDQE
jgi:cell division protein FtsL